MISSGISVNDHHTDKNLWRKPFEESAKAVEGLIDKSRDQGGKVKGLKTGSIPMITYLAHKVITGVMVYSLLNKPALEYRTFKMRFVGMVKMTVENK